MSITISITDPKSAPRAEIEALVAYFQTILGEAPAAAAPTVQVVVPPVPESYAAQRIPMAERTPGAPVLPAVPPTPPAPEPHAGRRVSDPVVDVRGFPWDARIHAESKSKNNDGSWRYRRGVKDDVIEPVERELRGVMGMAEQVAPVESVAAVPPAPPAASTEVPPPPPAPTATAPAEPSSDDFNHFANVAAKALAAKTISQAQITTILGEIGKANGCVLPHLGALFTRKDLIPEALARLQALIAAGGAQ